MGRGPVVQSWGVWCDARPSTPHVPRPFYPPCALPLLSPLCLAPSTHPVPCPFYLPYTLFSPSICHRIPHRTPFLTSLLCPAPPARSSHPSPVAKRVAHPHSTANLDPRLTLVLLMIRDRTLSSGCHELSTTSTEPRSSPKKDSTMSGSGLAPNLLRSFCGGARIIFADCTVQSPEDRRKGGPCSFKRLLLASAS